MDNTLRANAKKYIAAGRIVERLIGEAHFNSDNLEGELHNYFERRISAESSAPPDTAALKRKYARAIIRLISETAESFGIQLEQTFTIKEGLEALVKGGMAIGATQNEDEDEDEEGVNDEQVSSDMSALADNDEEESDVLFRKIFDRR